MSESPLLFALPGVVIVGFCVASCVCLRAIRRHQMLQAQQVQPNQVGYYQPTIPYMVPTVPVSHLQPLSPQMQTVVPSAPAVSSDAIGYPYATVPPPETYIPSPTYTYPATYPDSHVVLTTIPTGQRIQWSV